MPEREYFPAPAFKSEEIDSPSHVVRETGILIPLLLSDTLPNPSMGREFLKQSTLPFLEDAQRGFNMRPELVKEFSLRDLKRIVNENSQLMSQGTPSQKRWNESYSISLGIFIAMHELATPELTTNPDWPTFAALMPPRNAGETLERIAELKKFVGGIAEGEIKPRNLNRSREAAIRALGFFQVGKNLLDKLGMNKLQIKKTLQVAQLI